jgi:hypothetical protein
VNLAELLRDPAAALRFSPEEAAGLLAQLEGVAAVLRLAATAQAPPQEQEKLDGMLEPAEAARLAGLTVEQFYRRKVFRPAIVRAGHRTRRVNERKLRRILAGLGD